MTDSTLPGVLWLPDANAFPGREGNKPRYVILHGTAGITDEKALGNFFKSTENTNNPVASHYGIGITGGVAQYIAEANGAYANGVVTAGHDPWWSENGNPNPNDITISIEHGKPHDDNSDPLTPAQQASSFALVLDICRRNNIPMRPADGFGGITGHYSIDPVNRARCPGNYPWDALWKYLASQGGQDMPLQITDPFAAKYFKETSPTSWLCTTTGLVVASAILDYYRKTQGGFRLPLTSEIYNVIPGGSFQVFEAGVLAWDPQRKLDNPGQGDVYAMHLNRDTPGLRKLIAFAGLSVPAITQTEIDTAINAFKSAQASLAVGVTALEPIVKP